MTKHCPVCRQVTQQIVYVRINGDYKTKCCKCNGKESK
jgi:hypothetical protein